MPVSKLWHFLSLPFICGNINDINIGCMREDRESERGEEKIERVREVKRRERERERGEEKRERER